MSDIVPSQVPPRADWFENLYLCSECGTVWLDEWSCMCDDRCPSCDVSIQPVSSRDLSQPLCEADYLGVMKLLAPQFHLTRDQITDRDASDYAMALLEGGESRFDSFRNYSPT